VRSVHAGRTGTAVKVYADGSAAVHWDDGDPQPEGLAHERMPRRLLDVLEPAIPVRPPQTSLPNALAQLVNDALRASALAPTYIDALDIAGDALRRAADLVKAGANQRSEGIFGRRSGNR
jgi:hypothetical protein